MNKTAYIYLVVAMCLATIAGAQPSSDLSMDKILAAANIAHDNSNHYEAADLYIQAYEIGEDASILPGLVNSYLKLRDYESAAEWADKYLMEHKKSCNAGIRMDLASALIASGQYEKAKKQYELLQNCSDISSDISSRIATQLSGINMAMNAHAVKGIAVHNMGDINGISSEYSPFLTSEGTLYFSALQNEQMVSAEEDIPMAEIYAVDLNGASETARLSDIINKPGFNTANLTLSPDGKKMIFARQELTGEGKLRSSQLYISEYKSGQWKAPRHLKAQGSYAFLKSPAFGYYGGKEIVYFVSQDRENDDYDIYYAELAEGDVLKNTQRLSASINTPYDEESPFYKDGMLYFSSNGHAGYGGYDIFKIDINDKTALPENMGTPINSSTDDMYFMMPDDFNAVLVSNRTDQLSNSLLSATCCNDIYKVNIVNLQLELAIVDENGDALEDAMISLVDANGKELSPINQSPIRYQLYPDQSYEVIVKKKGYEDAEPYLINTTGQWESTILKESISLIEVEPEPVVKVETKPEVVTVAEPIVLEQILFDYDDDKILPEATGDLQYLLSILKQYPDIKIQISSHTDARGSKPYNQSLSQKRSDSVRNWLIAKGINPTRIQAVGLGSERPLKVYEKIAMEHSFLNVGQVLTPAFIKTLGKKNAEIAHQLNRRSEFEITDGPRVILKKK